jgi:hypothetical protein
MIQMTANDLVCGYKSLTLAPERGTDWLRKEPLSLTVCVTPRQRHLEFGPTRGACRAHGTRFFSLTYNLIADLAFGTLRATQAGSGVASPLCHQLFAFPRAIEQVGQALLKSVRQESVILRTPLQTVPASL